MSLIQTQIIINQILFFLSIAGILSYRHSILIILMCIELILLSVNLNFIIFSIYLNDFYGQIFALFVLTLAAAESAVGLAILIVYYRIRGKIRIHQKILIKG